MKTTVLGKMRFLVLGLALALMAGVVASVNVGLALAKDEPGERTQVLDGRGRIDWIGPGKIVINDTAYRYEAGTLFYSEDNRLIGSGAFAKGMWAAFILKPNAKYVIQKIWKTKPSK